jgi:hypothetical protein
LQSSIFPFAISIIKNFKKYLTFKNLIIGLIGLIVMALVKMLNIPTLILDFLNLEKSELFESIIIGLFGGLASILASGIKDLFIDYHATMGGDPTQGSSSFGTINTSDGDLPNRQIGGSGSSDLARHSESASEDTEMPDAGDNSSEDTEMPDAGDNSSEDTEMPDVGESSSEDIEMKDGSSSEEDVEMKDGSSSSEEDTEMPDAGESSSEDTEMPDAGESSSGNPSRRNYTAERLAKVLDKYAADLSEGLKNLSVNMDKATEDEE